MRPMWNREEARKVNPEPRKTNLGKRRLPSAKGKMTRAQRRELEKRRRWFVLRGEILRRDGYQCQYCKASGPGVRLEVDHIVPRASGGTNDRVNLITACQPCNKAKWAYRLGHDKEREIRGVAIEREAMKPFTKQECMNIALWLLGERKGDR